MRVAAAMLLLVAMAGARPLIQTGGVMNAASRLPAGLPGAALSPDGLFIIQGRQLGPGQPAHADQPTAALGGVSVEIVVSGRTWRALLFEAGERSIRAVVPVGIAYGEAVVVVIYEGQRSNPVDTRIVPASVGLFSLADDGGGPASELVVRRGQRVTLPVTGLGEHPEAARIEVFVGGRVAANVRAQNSQLSFDVPKDSAAGCNVPVQARTNGSIPSNVVTLRLETVTTVCAPQERVRSALTVPQTSTGGFAIPFRLRMLYELSPGDKVDLLGDALIAGARTGRLHGGLGNLLYPPARGSCSLYSTPGTPFDFRQEVTADFLADTDTLDAGPWTVTRPDGAVRTVAPRKFRGQFDYGEIGGSLSREDSAAELFLTPGLLTVAATGGADMQPFSLLVRFPQPLTWTNRSSIDVVMRARELEVKWSGGTGDWVLIGGVNIDNLSRVTAGFWCLAPAGAREFKIPAVILQSLPASRGKWDDSTGYLAVGSVPDRDVLAPVADGFVGLAAAFEARMVRFQ
jgi:hypothetical protein